MHGKVVIRSDLIGQTKVMDPKKLEQAVKEIERRRLRAIQRELGISPGCGMLYHPGGKVTDSQLVAMRKKIEEAKALKR